MDFSIQSYDQAQSILRGAGNRRVTYSTWLKPSTQGISLVHYDTSIVIYRKDGSLTLDNGGHWSSVTKRRINCGTPDGIHVWSDHGVWLVRLSPHAPGEDDLDPIRVPFTRCMTLRAGTEHPRGWTVERHCNFQTVEKNAPELGSWKYRFASLAMDYARCFVQARRLRWKERPCLRCYKPDFEDVMTHITEGEYPRELLLTAMDVCAVERLLRDALSGWEDGTPFPEGCVQAIKSCINKYLCILSEE